MNGKKLVTIILSFVLLITIGVLLTSCGNGQPKSESEKKAIVEQENKRKIFEQQIDWAAVKRDTEKEFTRNKYPYLRDVKLRFNHSTKTIILQAAVDPVYGPNSTGEKECDQLAEAMIRRFGYWAGVHSKNQLQPQSEHYYGEIYDVFQVRVILQLANLRNDQAFIDAVIPPGSHTSFDLGYKKWNTVEDVKQL